MKNIDNDIEQFEKNLIEIDGMRNQIFELKTSLDKMLKETGDIDCIKDDLNKEIESIHKTNENAVKQIDEKIKLLNEIVTDVKNSIGKDTDKIVEPIKAEISDAINKFNQISIELKKIIDNMQLKQDMIEKKINISIVIMSVGFVLVSLLILL